jgi:hypothetical protein
LTIEPGSGALALWLRGEKTNRKSRLLPKMSVSGTVNNPYLYFALRCRKRKKSQVMALKNKLTQLPD